MTPAAYIALARDIVILIALGLLIWLLVAFGRDMIKVKDMKAVQAQIAQNSQQVAQWAQEARDAQTQRTQDMAQVSAAIAAQHAPIVLRGPSSACPVPRDSAEAPSQSAAPGSADTGSGVDLRPAISGFELKYETALADCRQALASWPR